MNARLVLCAFLAVATIGLLVWAFTDQGMSTVSAPQRAAETAPEAAPEAGSAMAEAPSTPGDSAPPPPAREDVDAAGTGAAESSPPSPPTSPDPTGAPAGAGQPDGGGAIESFPDNWFYLDRPGGRRRAIPQSLEGRPMPRLQVRSWVGEAADLDNLRGKVVVVDFWATWCGPCVRSIPHNVRLVDKYRDEDLVFIGVHDSKRGFERAPALAERLGINYPIGVDDAGVSQRAWRVPFWPMYAVVDRNGIVRAAGLMPRYIEPAVQRLLEEGQ
jgi:thiol-disulfide isomerase/thioredoxin